MDKNKRFNIGDISLHEAVVNAVAHYGIEGAQETIKKVYSQMPTIRDKMLTKLREIYWNNDK